MGNFVFCRRCNPDMTDGAQAIGGLGTFSNGGGPLPEIPNECTDCNVCFIRLAFRTEAIGDLIVGAGNHSASGSIWATEQWVLFNNGDDYERDDSRPVKCKVTTIVNPDDATTNIVTAVDVNDGSFIWERKSTDVLDPDYDVFELTTGTIDTPVCNCGPCVGFDTEWHRTPFVWPSPAEDFILDATFEAIDAFCDEDFETPACLHYVADSTVIPVTDGWGFGGTWVHTRNYPGTDDRLCGEAALLNIGAGTINDECDSESGRLRLGITGCNQLFLWTGCEGDPREPPEPGDFVLDDDETAGACDDATINDLTYGGTCEDGDGSNCPPDDCSASYCKWTWNVDTLVWDLTFSSCLTGFECPPTPPDPTITDHPWEHCECCLSTAPECPPGVPECMGDTCTVQWDGFSWIPSVTCLTAGCSCVPPIDDGLFVRENRAGLCCNTGD